MIERIIIENFKSIRKLDLELKPVNILIGANGAGKSNFLSFFKLVRNTVGMRFSEANYDIDKLLYFGRKKSSKMIGEIKFGEFYAIKFTIVPRENSNAPYISENKILDNTESGDFWGDQAFKATKSENEHLRIYHFHDTGSSSPLKRMNELKDNRYLRGNGANLAAFLYYLQEKHNRDFKLIEAQIRSVAPFFDRFDLAPDRLNEDQIELRWLEKGSDNYFNAYDLSDSTLRFIALTTLLLQPDLPKTIIIDEPELGLHPFAINKLAAMMKQAAAKGSQVIVSTQSVNLVDNFEPEDVITVDREDNQSVFKRLNSEEIKEWLEDYTLGDLWNKNVIGARP
jgi:predicted ATPase